MHLPRRLRPGTTWLQPTGATVVAELGPVTRALIALADDGDDHVLAGRICRVCLEGLQVDGAAISVLTATEARETLSVTDATAAAVEDLQSPWARVRASRRPPLVARCWSPTSATTR